MNVLCTLAQSGLDAGALAVCCEGVFQKRSEARGRGYSASSCFACFVCCPAGESCSE